MAKECLENNCPGNQRVGADIQTEFLNTKSSPDYAIIEFAERESIDTIFLRSTGSPMLKKILIGMLN